MPWMGNFDWWPDPPYDVYFESPLHSAFFYNNTAELGKHYKGNRGDIIQGKSFEFYSFFDPEERVEVEMAFWKNELLMFLKVDGVVELKAIDIIEAIPDSAFDKTLDWWW